MSSENSKFIIYSLTTEHLFCIINSITIIQNEVNGTVKQNDFTGGNVFPSEEEMKNAQLVCCGRYCNRCETPAEYAWRKREVDMAALLERAIKIELSKPERETIIEYWYNSLSVSQIASKRGVTSAAIKSTLDRAQEKLEKVLSYAVMYQQDIGKLSIVPLVLSRARVIAAAKNASGGSLGDRLLRLRQSQSLSKKSVSKVIGIKQSRLDSLEKGVMPACDELIALSNFYGISTDYLLKGEINDEE